MPTLSVRGKDKIVGRTLNIIAALSGVCIIVEFIWKIASALGR